MARYNVLISLEPLFIKGIEANSSAEAEVIAIKKAIENAEFTSRLTIRLKKKEN